MKAEHFEILVEEPSMEAFLSATLPKIIGDQATFAIHVHQGKSDLLNKLGARLRAYAKWLPENIRIVVVVDRDSEECARLKSRLEKEATNAVLVTRTTSRSSVWQVVNRIAIEELEAWFFGEWAAVRFAYPRVPANIVNQAAYRQCDAIVGGTWEALERVFRKCGYFTTGIRKVEVAREVGRNFDHNACSSPSFSVFRGALSEAIV